MLLKYFYKTNNRRYINFHIFSTFNKIFYSLLNDYHYDIEFFHKISIETNLFDERKRDIYNIIIPQFYWGIVSNNTLKFKTLQEFIENKFLNKEQQEKIMLYFEKTQKHYRSLCKFAYICKMKLARKYDINTDLLFNDLDIYKKSIKISLLENNTIYNFKLSDLINLINDALTHHVDFFTEPKSIKNPYTNIEFSKSNLYNIYLKIRFSNFKMPYLFQKLIDCHFDMIKFENENEVVIRDIVLKNYVKNSSPDIIYDEIIDMLKANYKNRKILPYGVYIHKYFPKKILIEYLKPFLESYILYKYTHNPQIRYISYNKFKKIYKFFNAFPNFGRKYKST